MKFGNNFLDHQLDFPATYNGHFLDYVHLKQFIKLHIVPLSFHTFSSVVPTHTVDGQPNIHVANLGQARLVKLAAEISEFFSHLDSNVLRVSAFYSQEEDRVCAAALALQQNTDNPHHSSSDVIHAILRLQQFALLNLTALTKILKKHDRFTALGGYISHTYLTQVTKTHRFVRTSSRLASIKTQLVQSGIVLSVDMLSPKPSSWLHRLRPARGPLGSNTDEMNINQNQSLRRLSMSLPLLREGKTPTSWFPPTAALPGQRLLITLSGPHGTDITEALLRVLSTHNVKLEDFSFSRLHHQVTFAVRVQFPEYSSLNNDQVNIEHDSFVTDLTAAAKRWNATLLFDAPDPDTHLPPSLEDAPYNNRIKYTATVLNMTGLSVKFLHAFTTLLLQYRISVERMGRLNSSPTISSANTTLKMNQNQTASDKYYNPLTCIDYQLSVPQDADTDAFRSELFALSAPYGTDVALQEASVYRRSKRLVIFDMDSTLIEQEVIDEIARDAGVVDQVAHITELAMRGEIDFAESLCRRVSLLRGTPATILSNVRQRITFVPGSRELCRCLKRLGYKLAVISGGFLPLAHYVKSELGLDYAFANQLKVDSNNCLTGDTIGPIVTGQRKAELLEVIAQAEGITSEQVIAVGDGANDLWMLAAAGLGIAFNAKPKVQEKARTRINQRSLASVLYLLGYSDSDIETLLRDQ